MVAAAIVPGSRVRLKQVGLNETRDRDPFCHERDGGIDRGHSFGRSQREPVGDLVVETSSLHGVEIGGDTIQT